MSNDRTMVTRMAFQEISCVTFHDNAQEIALKLGELFPDIIFKIYECETEGDQYTKREKTHSVFNGSLREHK
jgi:hypothetical protein